jgi:uncharacterized protein YdeI (BOF family)
MVLCAAILLTGCGKPAVKTLGTPLTEAHATTVQQLPSEKDPSVRLTGVMVEKCPVSGCWFKLRDKTGIVHVDTKDAGFVVAELPLQTEVTVTGKFIKGDSPTVAASGVEYR